MNRESVDVVIFEKWNHNGLEEHGPGAMMFLDESACAREGVRAALLWLPGQESAGLIHFSTDQGVANANRRTWFFDGNEAKPTFSPSIHHPDVWHGHLREGRLVSC